MLDVRCYSILFAFALALAALTAGCTPTVPTPAPTRAPQMGQNGSLTARGNATLTSTVAAAAAAEAPLGLRVEIWQLRVPAGTVSRNEKFWKHVDEQCFDPATYDLLFKNGVRVGQAPIGEWDYFRQLMTEHPTVATASDLVAAESKPVEFTVRKDIIGEEIFYYDAGNRLIGKSFDASENLLAVTFQQAPRKPQTMRVAICPVVRSKFKRLEFSPLNKEQEITYTAPERLYDLNLKTDVPADSFLIVAPSNEATWSTSIGNNFFVTDGAAERMENLLLIVPKSIRIEQVANPPVRATVGKK